MNMCYNKNKGGVMISKKDEQIIKKIAKTEEDKKILLDIIAHSPKNLEKFNGESREDLLRQCLIARKSCGVLFPYKD